MSFDPGRKIDTGEPEKPAKKYVTEQAPHLLTLRQQVEVEIVDHDNWCGPNCQTFLPEAYRHHRLIDGDTAEEVQGNYDLCHIFR